MTKNIFRMGTILALSLAASQTFLSAQDTSSVEGVWNVTVTVTDCQGTTIRTVNSLQLFHRDGSLIETSNLSSRGISEGTWKRAGDRTYDASYWFFRYPPPIGQFASFAVLKDTITLADEDHFTSSGTVEDFKADGTTTTSCFTHTATRLSALEQDH